MAGRNDAAKAVSGTAQAQAAPALDRDKLTDRQLAKAVLAGALRPRAGEIRRLATALLKKDAPKPLKKKGKKAKSGKLAKIPQKQK